MTLLQEDTINKSILLNWLYSMPRELPIAHLEEWLYNKTGGKYTIVKQKSEYINISTVDTEVNETTKKENN